MVIDKGKHIGLMERTSPMPTLWAGIDAGKRTHHCVVIDSDGTVLLSMKVSNDETELLDLIATVIERSGGGEVCWATDLTDGGAALLIALLAAHRRQLLYIIPGRVVHHAAAPCRGDGNSPSKTTSRLGTTQLLTIRERSPRCRVNPNSAGRPPASM